VTRSSPFITGATYQHRRNEDVAMHVVKVHYSDPDHTKLWVRWWNIGYQYFCTDVIDTVRVQPKDFDGWKRVEL
jgi:hypothetical protein